MEQLLHSLVDGVVGLVQNWGYFGIFVMMSIESSLIPFPSEVAMIPAGYLVSQGKMDPLLALAAAIAGSLVGAIFNYALALWLGLPVLKRFGKYCFIPPEAFDRAEVYFRKHGEITTFVGRLLPAIRQLISIPAGLARMNFARFLTYTALGAGIWCAILIAIGYIAGKNENAWRPLLGKTTGWLLVGLALLVGVYILYFFGKKRKTNACQE